MKKSLFLLIGVLSLFSSNVYGDSVSTLKQRMGISPMLSSKSYKVAYDTRFKIPFWTKELLTPQSLEKNASRRGMRFFEDTALYSLHRSTLQDYRRSGFNRGHTAAAGNTTYDYDALKQTFKLSGILPQDPGNNQGFWNRLEMFVRGIVEESDEVIVLTGPLFLPTQNENGEKWVQFKVIGPNNVAVPTHLYKYVEVRKGIHIDRWAYLVPNENIERGANFEDYEVDLPYLEKVSGLRLLSQLTPPE